MKAYCQKCGSGTEYSFDKPKFCGSCGSALSITHASSVPKAPIQRQPQRKITPDIEEEEIETERVPENMHKLEVEIEGSSNRKADQDVSRASNEIIDISDSWQPEEEDFAKTMVDIESIGDFNFDSPDDLYLDDDEPSEKWYEI